MVLHKDLHTTLPTVILAMVPFMLFALKMAENTGLDFTTATASSAAVPVVFVAVSTP